MVRRRLTSKFTRGNPFTSGVAAAAVAAAARNMVKRKNANVAAHNKRVAAGNKRVASDRMSATSKRVRQTYRDAGSYQQRVTTVAKLGRKNTLKTFHNKLLSCSYDFTKYTARYYSAEGAGGSTTGSLYLPIGLQQGSASGNVHMPLYCFNLSCKPQYISGSLQSPPVAWRAYTPGTTTSSINWVNYSGIDGSGYSPYNYLSYGTPAGTGNGDTPTCRRSLLEYVNLKYTLAGPRNRWTRFTVQVVQPFAWFSSMPGGQDPGPTYNYVWRQMIDRLTYNQCQSVPKTTGSGWRAPWKVLFTKTYTIQPTETTESDQAGHEVHQKLYMKVNKVLDFSYSRADPTDGLTNNSLTAENQSKSTTTDPRPGQSVWLIVYAHSPNLDSYTGADPPGSGQVSTLISPSFDLSIETKHSWLNGSYNA